MLVSILVLLDLCIKTIFLCLITRARFQVSILVLLDLCIKTNGTRRFKMSFYSFNPCFIGSMYKNSKSGCRFWSAVLSFNPCFIGSMYKNFVLQSISLPLSGVSILVLLDLCIKTVESIPCGDYYNVFQSLFYWIYV